MKRFLLIALTVLVPFVGCGPSAAEPAVGEAAPDFNLIDPRDQYHALSQQKGRFVVLEWINHDCPFVKKHYDSGNMQALQKKYTQKGVVWYSICSSVHGKQGHYHSEDWMRLTAEKGAAPTAVLIDHEGETGKLYGAKTTPHMYIVDPDGVLIYKGGIDDIPSADPGDIPGSVNYVSKALDEALAGQPVSEPSTKPYGCSVKY